MSRIFLDWNLGLGDAIVCNGMVRELAKVHERILLPCYRHLEPSVRWMFSDLPSVEFLPVDADSVRDVEGWDTLCVGIHAVPQPPSPYFDEGFYQLAGIPFDCSWSSFYMPPRSIAFSGRPSVLVFESWSGGLARVPVEGVRPPPQPTIADLIPAIRAAAEIHCITSAPLHLVDRVQTFGKLFFWHNARRGSRLTLRKSWRFMSCV